MNQHPGVIGRKLGMTQVFGEDGTVTPCTVIESEAIVVGKRTVDKDGYSALIVGLGERPEKRANKPLAGFYKKSGATPKALVQSGKAISMHSRAVKPETSHTLR